MFDKEDANAGKSSIDPWKTDDRLKNHPGPTPRASPVDIIGFPHAARTDLTKRPTRPNDRPIILLCFLRTADPWKTDDRPDRLNLFFCRLFF